MQLFQDYLFPVIWVAYIAYWWALSAKVKATTRSESGASRFVRLALLLCAIALLSLPYVPIAALSKRFLPPDSWCFWSGAIVTACGLLFSLWGRGHLGENWSQEVTVKEGHELITSGPYALVRHPIYTGLLLGILGSAIARREWRGLLAVALVFGVLWHKLRLEEKWMRAQFGESYETYSHRVAALVPHIL